METFEQVLVAPARHDLVPTLLRAAEVANDGWKLLSVDPADWVSAVVEITAVPHTGCGKFTSRFGIEAMKFVNSPLGRDMQLRGVNAKVVVPGTVRVGDVARKR